MSTNIFSALEKYLKGKSEDLIKKLRDLKEAWEDGLIDDNEFGDRMEAILTEYLN